MSATVQVAWVREVSLAPWVRPAVLANQAPLATRDGQALVVSPFVLFALLGSTDLLSSINIMCSSSLSTS